MARQTHVGYSVAKFMLDTVCSDSLSWDFDMIGIIGCQVFCCGQEGWSEANIGLI